MKKCSGMTIIELLVSLVIGSLVMIGVYTLWLNHQKQVNSLERKVQLRNHMILSCKKIQVAITNAGIGLPEIHAVNVNLDTLTVFSNKYELSSPIQNNIPMKSTTISVYNPSLFSIGSYLAISDSVSGELHKIISKNGYMIMIDSGVSREFLSYRSKTYPVLKEMFYLNHTSHSLNRRVNDSITVISNEITDFKINLINKVVYLSITGHSSNSSPLTFNLSTITRNSI